MRLPNGYGSVYKLSNNRARRKPYAVRITIGYNSRNQPIYRFIGYYHTRKEGLAALAEYHKGTITLGSSSQADITMQMIAQKVFDRASKTLSEKTLHEYQNAYLKYFACIANTKVKDIRLEQIQGIIDMIESAFIQSKVKSVYRLFETYALEYQLMSRSIVDFVVTKKQEHITLRSELSHEEIELIRQEDCTLLGQIVMCLLYTGMRLNELLTLKCGQVNVKEWYLVGGNKTAAGKNRTIPIHPKIQQYIADNMREPDELLFPMEISRFRVEWKLLMHKLGKHHVPHECRHTLRSELDRQGANPISIDRIMGHTSIGVGAIVYTHKNLDDLRKAIMLVTY